ncbi:TlpA family protein disulfide reductase [Nonlabens sp.]|uniref:TlpA family protein disulfide reductase n=1 Tax=Nonlabens sp. TaxID=1888209 RepID=UPI003F6956AA
MKLRFIVVLLIALISITSCKTKKEESLKPDAIAVDRTTDKKTVYLETPDGSYTDLDALLDEHKGKVVYIDYWASWCRPCRAMMPASRKLKEKYKGEDVVFLYISIDTKRPSWERANKEEGFTEHSYIATNYPKAKLFQLRNVNSIPRYMLYDKKGNMVNDNALRPVQPQLVNVIDGLLAK